ncbi:hypothetical protein ACFQ1M_17160 [Sungkyunkwania multivorans]|uniref:Uncharacterized protein n=1 Tax=Sungkyunkwania multivorans TaxID=1173618 RepID=A0ABW3D1U5_9FLAO
MKKIFITILAIAMVQSVFSQDKMVGLTFEYETFSRGFYQKIKVEKGTLLFQENRSESDGTIIDIDKKQWKKLVDWVKKIKLEHLSLLKAPTNKREVDGAAFAKLKVFTNDKEYVSSNFDHGNPPLEIKGLVENIIELSQLGKKD